MVRGYLMCAVLAAYMGSADHAVAQSCHSPSPDTQLSQRDREAMRSALSNRPARSTWRDRVDSGLQAVLGSVDSSIQAAAFDDSGADLSASSALGLSAYDNDLATASSTLRTATAEARGVVATAQQDATALFDQLDVQNPYSGFGVPPPPVGGGVRAVRTPPPPPPFLPQDNCATGGPCELGGGG